MLCWEGYDSASIVDPFVSRNPACFEAETLLSDIGIAQRLVDGDFQNWDILNINNAYIRDYLHPRGLIKTLPEADFTAYRESIHPAYSDLVPWSIRILTDFRRHAQYWTFPPANPVEFQPPGKLILSQP